MIELNWYKICRLQRHAWTPLNAPPGSHAAKIEQMVKDIRWTTTGIYTTDPDTAQPVKLTPEQYKVLLNERDQLERQMRQRVPSTPATSVPGSSEYTSEATALRYQFLHPLLFLFRLSSLSLLLGLLWRQLSRKLRSPLAAIG